MRIKFPRRQSKVEWGGIDTVSFESSISQAAQALDLAGYYASHRRDSEGLVQVSHGWARLGEVFLALPYVVTLVALVMRGRNSRTPSALGVPFDRRLA